MFRTTFLSIAATLAIVAPAAAAPCKNIPTIWTMSSTFIDNSTASRIYGDGTPYTDGARGVSATIKICSGTHDAVLIVDSGRTILFNFGGAFLGASSTAPPAWTSGAPFASTPTNVRTCAGSPCTLLNIRNILDSGDAPRNQYYVLYTRLSSALVGPDGISYHLFMHNPATCPGVACNPDDGSTNSPALNARVVVEHFPANGSSHEYWLVYPETPTLPGSMSPSPENGALMSNDRTINYGQFSMPFLFRIEVK